MSDFVWLAVWITAAVALVLRRRLGLGVLLLFELVHLFGELAAFLGWDEEPGDWLMLCAQVVLVLLLLSPAMDRYASRHPNRSAGEGTSVG